ncbi:hypothetical protein SDD30_16045 [Moorella naiadis]|uniref:hypothetical protein n=1 Tax=Moorella naiadis (nom. illeg.) TaxID=3093670 RepID=UPI003D9CBE18
MLGWMVRLLQGRSNAQLFLDDRNAEAAAQTLLEAEFLEFEGRKSPHHTPVDFVTNRPTGGLYCISTVRVPRGGYQTAMFNPKKFLWAFRRPLFRIDEVTYYHDAVSGAVRPNPNPFNALKNHIVAMLW